MVMIDWVTAKIPCSDPRGVNDGRLTRCKRDGSIDWCSDSRLSVGGSHSSTVSVLKREGSDVLEFSGNPAKFLQGHNLFGSSDLPFLMWVCLSQVFEKIGLKPTKQDWVKIRNGDYTVSRVDINDMVSMQSRAEVRTVLRALADQASIKYKGRGQFVGETLYFGKKKGSSANWSLKMYCKADEVGVHDLPEDFFVSPQAFDFKGRRTGLPDYYSYEKNQLVEWVDNKLRIEVVLGRKELHHTGLVYARCFTCEQVSELFSGYLTRLRFAESVCVTVEMEQKLPRAIARSLSDWREGKDLRQLLSKSVFYRHRKIIQDELGIDISLLQPKGAKIIPLQRDLVLDFKSAALPEGFKSPAYLVDNNAYWRFIPEMVFSRAA